MWTPRRQHKGALLCCRGGCSSRGWVSRTRSRAAPRTVRRARVFPAGRWSGLGCPGVSWQEGRAAWGAAAWGWGAGGRLPLLSVTSKGLFSGGPSPRPGATAGGSRLVPGLGQAGGPAAGHMASSCSRARAAAHNGGRCFRSAPGGGLPAPAAGPGRGRWRSEWEREASFPAQGVGGSGGGGGGGLPGQREPPVQGSPEPHR